MKKKLLKLTITFAMLLYAVFIFIGCNKNILQKDEEQELKIQLVSKDIDRIVAEKFNSEKFLTGNNNKSSGNDIRNSNGKPNKILLLGKNSVKNDLVYNDHWGKPALYIFNFNDNAGFLFVSADFGLRPILAFIDNGEFKKDSIPDGFQDWINRTIENIEVIRKGLYDNSHDGALAWNRYFQENNLATTVNPQIVPPDLHPCDNPQTTVYTVGPLLPVTWGQLCSYNDLCDLTHVYGCGNPCVSTRPATGCVATSMAQIIRFHQFPTNYNYATMPMAAGNNAVQILMRDAGLSVNMNYGCSSGAYGSAVPDAFKNTFHYGSANRWSYSTTSGYSRIQTNINNHWPVLFEGRDTNAGGHEWVCDGYRETIIPVCAGGIISATYLSFHMNWGWHEQNLVGTDYNGWFAFDNWNIPGLNWNFQYSRYAVTEIHP
jgi:hypothetical protein